MVAALRVSEAFLREAEKVEVVGKSVEALTSVYLLTMDWRAVWEDRPGQEAAGALLPTNGHLCEQYSTQGAHSSGSCRQGAFCLGKAMPVLPSHNPPAYCG